MEKRTAFHCMEYVKKNDYKLELYKLWAILGSFCEIYHFLWLRDR